MSLRQILPPVLFMLLIPFGAQFEIPELTLEAFSPKGFSLLVEATAGIQQFAFHANINKKIGRSEVGEINAEFTRSRSNWFNYSNSNIALQPGDYLSYWIFIQHDNLGYRKDDLIWNVTELVKLDTSCPQSETYIRGKSAVCKGAVLFEDNFKNDKIDTQKWLIEHYIPFMDPNYEFVSYQKSSDVCFIKNEQLFIKPKPDAQQKAVLNLRQSCSRTSDDECYFEKDVYIPPPVVSGKLVSHLKFRYGEIEIKAKLPAGDWIFPKIQLENVDNPNQTLWIAYARGNDKLLSDRNEDFGSRLLFGGPILFPDEPNRSLYLASKRYEEPITSSSHVFKLIWTKDKMILSIDGEAFGEITSEIMNRIKFAEQQAVHLVLGVGVGGINDFPDNFKTGNDLPKPWINKSPLNKNQFFHAKSSWIGTWTGDRSALQVDYVRITAL